MKFLTAALACLLFGVAQAGPVVEDVATITPPSSAWQYFGRFGVAIDGDYALVSAERYEADATVEGGQRHLAATFVYQRSGSAWTLLSKLGPTTTVTSAVAPGLAMKDGVVMTITDRWRLWERNGSTFTLTNIFNLPAQAVTGHDIEIDGGRILVARAGCSQSAVVFSKTSGRWAAEGELGGEPDNCRPNAAPVTLDIDGTRALVHTPSTDPYNSFVRFYRLNAMGTGWDRVNHFSAYITGNRNGPGLAVNGKLFAISGSMQFGTSISYELDEPVGAACCAFANFGGLQTVDNYFEPTGLSGAPIEHVGTYFAQRNYSYDRKTYVVNLFQADPTPPNINRKVATLQPRVLQSLGNKFDGSGNRIIVNGWANNLGNNTVRIFELPSTFEELPVQQHDFELASDGAAWQPSAGSRFTVVKNGKDGVLLLDSFAIGQSGSAYLLNTHARDQAIQVDITPLNFTGTNPTLGVVTRRSDESNYYHAAFTRNNTIELRRVMNGTSTLIASAFQSWAPRRLRLESIGTLHRVYVDDVRVLSARDSRLREGVAGIRAHEASAYYDDVIVSGRPLTTIYAQDFNSGKAGPWAGSWPVKDGRMQQLNTSGQQRNVIGAHTHDQIVQVNITPLTFETPNTWVGMLVRYQDAGNHAYVAMEQRGVVSLWKRTNGVIQQLATARWSAGGLVRVEAIGNKTRVFVGDGKTLLLSSNTDLGPGGNGSGRDGLGQVGLNTNRATAEYDDFLAYQP